MRRRSWLSPLVDQAATLHEDVESAVDEDNVAWRTRFEDASQRARDFRSRLVGDAQAGTAVTDDLVMDFDAVWDYVDGCNDVVVDMAPAWGERQRDFLDAVCTHLERVIQSLEARDVETARDVVGDVRDALSVYAHGLRDVSEELGRLRGAVANKRRGKTRRGA